MTTAPHLLAVYQQLIGLSQGMLRLASEGCWDELIKKETEYVRAVQHLAQASETATLSGQALAQLRPMLRHILDNESEVKRLLQARMAELSSLVGQSSRQKSVMSAYGKSGTVLVPRDKF
ncbi:flagella biosynthesis regulatory protein FliT [Pantoea sp.]|uniref:flagella biosynthesis regulatory protein FliT n=1 Tax=Pantoea sp. TaxID=69393 RepID=UPI0028998AEE|nr:flagella biosynthesis regulatory protein FliT [Pantoea sp.]